METTTQIEDVLNAVVERLAKEYKPEQVILFGSYAYGSPHRHSDLDLFIVKEPSPFTSGNRFERWNTVSNLLSDIPDCPYVHAEVFTPREIERRLQQGDQYIETILDEGRRLYGKATYARPRRTKEMDLAYASDWIATAEADLDRVRRLLEDADTGAAYHLQQACEKFLKAYLLSKGWRLERTHLIHDLLDKAAAYSSDLLRFRPACVLITKFLTAGRYPADEEHSDPLGGIPLTVELIRETSAKISGLIDFIRNELKEEPAEDSPEGKDTDGV